MKVKGVKFVHTLISRKLKHHIVLLSVKASESNSNLRSVHGKINCHHWLEYSRRHLCYGQHFAKLDVVVLQFNLMRVEVHELRPKVVTEGDGVLVHY